MKLLFVFLILLSMMGGSTKADEPPCGNGIVGTGLCEDPFLCCSKWGYCDSTEAHCDPSTCWSGPACSRRGAPCGDGTVGTGLCEDNSLCCSKWGYCDNTQAHCDPSTCWSGPGCPRDGAPCGDGIVGTGLCENPSLCCSQYGYCDSTAEHCDADTCYSSPDNTCTREAAVPVSGSATSVPTVIPSLPPTTAPPDNAVTDETVVGTAKLLVDIEPLMKDVLDALDQDPTNQELLDELRDLSIHTWSSDSGMQLAVTLDASDTPDPIYVQLRDSADTALSMYCEQLEKGTTKFSQAAVDCVCGKTSNPSTYCAAVADRELLDYLTTAADRRRRHLRHSSRQLLCKAEKPDDNDSGSPLQEFLDVYTVFQQMTEGKSFCLEAECDIPFPPPIAFLGVELKGGGCLPGLDLRALKICEGGTCDSIEDRLKETGKKALINQATDPRVFLSGGLCLLGTDDVPFISDVILPALELFGLLHCFAEFKLSFWPLMGYLGFDISVGGGIKMGVSVEAQFYDNVKDAFGVCGLLEGDECSGQEDDDQGQNSCSLCAGDDRGEFFFEIGFWIFKKKFDFPWGDGTDGECLNTCNGRSSGEAVEAVLEASKVGINNNLFLYQTPQGTWEPSSVYRYDGFLAGLRVMCQDGVANNFFYVGDSSSNGHKYGLVNIAAFLAQSMKETIQYDACDENSWDIVNGKYPLSNSCGQLEQSYQDYHCSAEQAHMECQVDPNMQITAVTHAKWWGAPAPLKCGPKTKYPFTGYWDHLYECNKPWLDPPEMCTDYEGQLGGGENNDAPYASSGGRTDVEGCCWWGRGVIQTTGVCNFGKLNYFLGKRAADEGRPSRYPTIDFCRDPEAICSSQEFTELKWIAGMFYWVDSVQSYNQEGWDYKTKLHEFVNGGMTDMRFIDAVSGIVNRGCHNPPCGTGPLDGGPERKANFQKALNVFGLASRRFRS